VKAPNRVDAESLAATIIDFHTRHSESYGYSAEGEPVELVNIRLRAVGAIPKPDLRETGLRGELNRVGTRRVYFETNDSWVETPIYIRGGSWNREFAGPAVIEQYDATTVVYPGWSVATDELGNMILGRAER
jgi:N-methylhydantoinase A